MKLLLPLTLLTLGSAFAQGPLVPPNTTGPDVGPVAPLDGGGNPQATMKTLYQVEPRIALAGGSVAHTISQPGSYYLTANLAQSGTSSAITVTAQNVTLDLNGFSVIGNGSGTTVAGISGANATHLTVRNGIIRGWSGHGISVLVESSRIEKVRVHDNAGSGISLGHGAMILDCQARGNTSRGFSVGENAIIRGCQAVANGNHSIMASNKALVESCATDGGTRGVMVGSASTVRSTVIARPTELGIMASDNCTASGCTVDGIPAGTLQAISMLNGAKVEHCTVTSCVIETGIFVGKSSLVSDCVVKSCTVKYGIRADAGGTIARCVIGENTHASTESAGIYVLDYSSLIDCNTSQNMNTGGSPTERMGAGIIANSEVTIRGCTSSKNHGAGIILNSICTAIDNTCEENGSSTGNGPGIFSTAFNNRIQGNTVAFNDTGIRLTNFPNVVIKNVSRGNGWTIAAGNHVAPMVTLAPTAVAISGSTGGVALGTTDPYANLMY